MIDKDKTVQCYDTLAPIYSFVRQKTHKVDNEIMPFVLNTLAPREEDIILDAGTGPGIYAIKLAEREPRAKIIGVDLSPKFLALANKNMQKTGLKNIEFIQGDLENLPFESNTFTKLVCAGVISAVPHKDKATKEIYRVLRPGGKAVIVEPNKGKNIYDRLFLYLQYLLGVINPKLKGFHVHDFDDYYFSQEKLIEICYKAGFSSIEIEERRGSFCVVCFKEQASLKC